MKKTKIMHKFNRTTSSNFSQFRSISKGQREKTALKRTTTSIASEFLADTWTYSAKKRKQILYSHKYLQVSLVVVFLVVQILVSLSGENEQQGSKRVAIERTPAYEFKPKFKEVRSVSSILRHKFGFIFYF